MKNFPMLVLIALMTFLFHSSHASSQDAGAHALTVQKQVMEESAPAPAPEPGLAPEPQPNPESNTESDPEPNPEPAPDPAQ